VRDPPSERDELYARETSANMNRASEKSHYRYEHNRDYNSDELTISRYIK